MKAENRNCDNLTDLRMDKHFLIIDNGKISLRNVVKCTYVEFEVLCKIHKIRHKTIQMEKIIYINDRHCLY